MSADMGGPAFPDPSAAHPGAHPPLCHKGMTLWDYYAAAALTGVSVNVENAELATDWAARCADAMLKKRARRMETES